MDLNALADLEKAKVARPGAFKPVARSRPAAARPATAAVGAGATATATASAPAGQAVAAASPAVMPQLAKPAGQAPAVGSAAAPRQLAPRPSPTLAPRLGGLRDAGQLAGVQTRDVPDCMQQS